MFSTVLLLGTSEQVKKSLAADTACIDVRKNRYRAAVTNNASRKAKMISILYWSKICHFELVLSDFVDSRPIT